MKRLPEVDAVIVGGGWTGLLMAKELATRTGHSVLVLERGGPRKTADFSDDMDELDYSVRLRMMQDAARETVTLRHTVGDRALPLREFGSFLPGTGVGGAGEHWAGVAFRFFPDAFDLLTRTRDKYGVKRLPEDHAIEDWGLTYDDLEPHYWRAEQLLGVSGKAGNLRGRRIEGGNVFEGPRQLEYPTPPMKTPYGPALFRDAAKSLGYHPFPIPSANTSQAYTNPDGVSRPGCVYCGYCERFGCMIGAKAQPTNSLLPVVSKRKNFTLRTGASVRRIIAEGGLARGVVYVDKSGEEVFQPAGVVFLASWTLNNTRLLLLSKIGRPYDPSSRRGTLGRNLTHQVVASSTVFLDRPLNRFMGAGACGIAISDFDGDVFDHSKLPFLRGGFLTVSALGSRPIANFGVVPLSVKRGWGSEWKKAAIHYFDRTTRVTFIGEHLAYRENYMDLDPTYTDQYGDPLLRLTLDWRDNERHMVEFITARAVEIGRAMGAREIAPFPGLKRYDARFYQSTHIQGGTIMGTSLERSVVNPYQQHWDVSNLFVLGGSTYPQNPSGNPTLTALALTYRTADAVMKRYWKRPGPLQEH